MLNGLVQLTHTTRLRLPAAGHSRARSQGIIQDDAYSIPEPHKKSGVIYRYRSVVPEQFLEYALRAPGAGDLLVGKDLVIVTVLYSGQKTKL
jgi:hypothetical protein